jgi:AbrB family looped-hinge helix DNA binding protein
MQSREAVSKPRDISDNPLSLKVLKSVLKTPRVVPASAKGQIVIPQGIRTCLGIKPGTKLPVVTLSLS